MFAQMWQFGCCLYLLCTGFDLFEVDKQENVRREELQRIADWNDDEKERKMARIMPGWPSLLVKR